MNLQSTQSTIRLSALQVRRATNKENCDMLKCSSASKGIASSGALRGLKGLHPLRIHASPRYRIAFSGNQGIASPNDPRLTALPHRFQRESCNQHRKLRCSPRLRRGSPDRELRNKVRNSRGIRNKSKTICRYRVSIPRVGGGEGSTSPPPHGGTDTL
jgi:hypothetical protein